MSARLSVCGNGADFARIAIRQKNNNPTLFILAPINCSETDYRLRAPSAPHRLTPQDAITGGVWLLAPGDASAAPKNSDGVTSSVNINL